VEEVCADPYKMPHKRTNDWMYSVYGTLREWSIVSHIAGQRCRGLMLNYIINVRLIGEINED